MKKPFVSILMPLYNAESYIKESVYSILSQSYNEFEFIIINDGSTDNSGKIVEQIKDSRIKYFSIPNSGMAAALNYGLTIARGKYIARQDADDISYVERIEAEVDFLEADESVALVGSMAKIISNGNESERFLDHPADSDALRLFLLFDNPFVHSSVMIRKTALDKVGNYNQELPALVQDYDLWSRLAEKFPVRNIKRVLVDYREVADSISRTAMDFKKDVIMQSAGNFARTTGFAVTECIAIPALYYGKYELISKKLSMKKLMNILNKAFDEICSENTEVNMSLEKRKDEIRKSIRRKIRLYNIFGKSMGRILTTVRLIRRP
jgi:glycosyltransferase involved in cell wall biosynthesis